MVAPPIFDRRAYPEALALANNSGRLLIVDATAAWCQPCKVMDRETWSSPDVAAWVSENAIAIQVDVDEHREVATALHIKAMPTVIAIRDGREFDRIVGMRDPTAMLEWFGAVLRGESAVDRDRQAAAANAADMGARLTLARSLATARRFDEATEEYVWLWQHVLEYEPAMVGVRASYMLHEIGRLVKDHEVARVRFQALRDRLEVDVASGEATADTTSDWIALNKALCDEQRVLDCFDQTPDRLLAHPEHGSLVRSGLQRLLIEHGRWADVARLCSDPIARLRRYDDNLDHAAGHPEPMRSRVVEAHNRMFLREASVFYVSLLAAGRGQDARAVADEARRLRPDLVTDDALAESAREAGFPGGGESAL
jgi:thioredoxin 1